MRAVTRYVCWSGDGKWIYFTSLHTGDCQIWKMPGDGGYPKVVTHTGMAAFVSGDGRWIWYMKTPSPMTSLWRIPAEGRLESEMVSSVLYRNAAACR